MDRARASGRGPGELGAGDREGLWPVRALFQRRVAGDDALLELAGLRFAQMGVAAEVYADTPAELEHLLRFVPPHRHMPVVHLNRGVNVLQRAQPRRGRGIRRPICRPHRRSRRP